MARGQSHGGQARSLLPSREQNPAHVLYGEASVITQGSLLTLGQHVLPSVGQVSTAAKGSRRSLCAERGREPAAQGTRGPAAQPQDPGIPKHKAGARPDRCSRTRPSCSSDLQAGQCWTVSASPRQTRHEAAALCSWHAPLQCLRESSSSHRPWELALKDAASGG